MRTTIPTAAIAAMLLAATTVLAGPTPEQKCQAAKNSAAGKYAACRQSAEKTRVSTGDVEKYDDAIAKCETRFHDAWQKAIDNATNAEATCPDAPLAAADYKSLIDAHSSDIGTALAGGGLPVPDACGNATVDAGEDCDIGTLGGQTCSTATAGVAPYGTLNCGAGCTFNVSGCFGCPGQIVNGSCWILGWEGDSCVNACAGLGMTYDPATASAGSAGSDESCLALALTLRGPSTQPLYVQGTYNVGFGCARFSADTVIRDSAPTTGEAVNSQMERYCACR